MRDRGLERHEVAGPDFDRPALRSHAQPAHVDQQLLVHAGLVTVGVPFAPAIERVGDAPPQRDMANAAQQVANVRGQFTVAPDLPPGACLLVDDIRFSGWTLAMLAGQLRRRGAPAVYPLALSTAF